MSYAYKEKKERENLCNKRKNERYKEMKERNKENMTSGKKNGKVE